MARYLVHLLVFNDVVTEKPMGGADNQWVNYHKVFRHNKLSKALKTFEKCVESEKARWEYFNKFNNDAYNSANIMVKYRDNNGVFKHFFEITGLGYVMHGSPECISRVWIEDTQNFIQRNNAVKNERIEKQRSLNFSHDIWERAYRNKGVKPRKHSKNI